MKYLKKEKKFTVWRQEIKNVLKWTMPRLNDTKKSAIPYMQKLLNCEENMKNSDKNGTRKGVKRKITKIENERIKRRKPG